MKYGSLSCPMVAFGGAAFKCWSANGARFFRHCRRRGCCPFLKVFVSLARLQRNSKRCRGLVRSTLRGTRLEAFSQIEVSVFLAESDHP